MRNRIITLAVWLSVLSAPLAVWAAPTLPQPNPSLSVREVVQLQLDALRSVDQPFKDAGFAVVYNFSSPENREQTGPLPRFAQMVREGFGEMVNHRSANLPATVQQAEQALQPVELTSFSGRSYRYVFILRRQLEGEYAGCWMTDGVIPQDGSGHSTAL